MDIKENTDIKAHGYQSTWISKRMDIKAHASLHLLDDALEVERVLRVLPGV
jgi:hypothetical protein